MFMFFCIAPLTMIQSCFTGSYIVFFAAYLPDIPADFLHINCICQSGVFLLFITY